MRKSFAKPGSRKKGSRIRVTSFVNKVLAVYGGTILEDRYGKSQEFYVLIIQIW